jgi:hypothetical protein
MIEPAVVAALAAVGGGIVAVTARAGWKIALGLAVAIAAAPLAASPLPGSLSLLARFAGAMLAAYLLWVGTRVKAIRSDGSAIGLAAETAIAAAAFLIGLWIAPVKPLPGPAAEQAAGLALVALAVIPLIGRDVLRVGIGAALLAVGLSLLSEAWLGPAQPFEQFALAALLVAILGATSLLVAPAAEMAAAARAIAGAAPALASGAATASGGAPASGAAPAPASGEAPAAIDASAEVPVAPDAWAEPAPPRMAPRARSMARRTRHPRGSEPPR